MAASGGAPIAPSLIPGGAGVHNAQGKPGSPARINGPTRPSRPGAAPGKIGGRQGGGAPRQQPGGQFGITASNPLLNPGQTLSGPSLYQAAQGLATAQTQPAIKALVDQIAQNQRQTQGAENLTGNYFTQLGQQAQQGLTAEQGISSSLNDQLKQLAASQSSQLQGLGQQDTAMLAKYSPQSDANNSLLQPGLSALTSELARQQGLQAQQQGAARAFGLNQGANYQGLAASNLGSFASRGEEDLNQIAQAGQIKNQPLTSKIAQLRGTYGATLASDLGKLRQQEITNNIAEQGLGIKQADIAATIADNIRNNQTSNLNNQRTTQTSAANNQRTTATSAANNLRTTQTSTANNIRSNDVRQALAAAKLAAQSGTGATKPLALSQQNTIYRNLNEMTTLISQAQKAGHSAAQIKQALQTGSLQKGFPAQDPYLVEAAYELLGWGHILPQTAAAMHAHGLRGGTYNNKPIQVGPAPPPSTLGNFAPAGNAVQNIISGAVAGLGG